MDLGQLVKEKKKKNSGKKKENLFKLKRQKYDKEVFRWGKSRPKAIHRKASQ